MNVNPVTLPGATSTVQVDTRAKALEPSAPARDHGQVLRRDLSSVPTPKGDTTISQVDKTGNIDDADREKADQLRAFVANEKFSLSTYHDESSGRHIVEVRDQATGDVVTQYPSEELIRLYSSLRESLVDQVA